MGVVLLWPDRGALRLRKDRICFYAHVLIALLLPTMVTAAPPNFVRTLGALPPIFALPGIGVATLFNRLQLIHHRGTEGTEKI